MARLFEVLDSEFSEGDWRTYLERLNQKGWQSALYELRPRQDLEYDAILVPADQGNTKEFPVHHAQDNNVFPSFGEALLNIAWTVGLSPRLHVRRLANSPLRLNFVPYTLPAALYRPPTVAMLAQTRQLNVFQTGDEPRGKPLLEVLTDLETAYGIASQAHPDLQGLFVFVDMTSVSFTEVLDFIALSLDATWDWQATQTLLLPHTPGGCRTCASSNLDMNQSEIR